MGQGFLLQDFTLQVRVKEIVKVYDETQVLVQLKKQVSHFHPFSNCKAQVRKNDTLEHKSRNCRIASSCAAKSSAEPNSKGHCSKNEILKKGLMSRNASMFDTWEIHI